MALFELGNVEIAPETVQAVRESGSDANTLINHYIAQHSNGDFGNIGKHADLLERFERWESVEDSYEQIGLDNTRSILYGKGIVKTAIAFDEFILWIQTNLNRAETSTLIQPFLFPIKITMMDEKVDELLKTHLINPDYQNFIDGLLARHHSGDFGLEGIYQRDISPEKVLEIDGDMVGRFEACWVNSLAINRNNGTVLSAYRCFGRNIWVTTSFHPRIEDYATAFTLSERNA